MSQFPDEPEPSMTSAVNQYTRVCSDWSKPELFLIARSASHEGYAEDVQKSVSNCFSSIRIKQPTSIAAKWIHHPSFEPSANRIWLRHYKHPAGYGSKEGTSLLS